MSNFLLVEINQLLDENARMAAVKNYLRQLRTAQGLTLQQVADRVGTSNQQVSHHENGKRRLTVEWLQRYSRALECHPTDITDGPGQVILAEGPKEKTLLQTFRGLSEPEKRALIQIGKNLLRAEGDKKKSTRRKKK